MLSRNERNRIEFVMDASETLLSGSYRALPQVGDIQERAPTHPLRLRAFANQVKSVVLPGEHDPFQPQRSAIYKARRIAKKEALRDGNSDVMFRPALAFDERTLTSWWSGNVDKPHDDKIALGERLSKGASRWLEFSVYGSAIQRHLDALDVRCDDRLLVPFRPYTEEWLSPRFANLDKCMAVADQCWSIFTSFAAPDPQTVGLATRMSPSGVMPEPTFMFPSPPPAKWLAEDRGNAYVFDVHPSVRHLHVSTNRFGLLSSLLRLGVLSEGAEPQPWWYSALVFDMASCVSMALIYALFGPRGNPASNVGEAWIMIDTINRSIFDEQEYAAQAMLTGGTVLGAMTGLPADVVTRFLRSARQEYYQQLAAVGISFRDVFSITNPELSSGNPAFVRAA